MMDDPGTSWSRAKTRDIVSTQEQLQRRASERGRKIYPFMADVNNQQELPRKRIKLEESIDIQTDRASPLTSLDTPITPPQRKIRLSNPAAQVLQDPPSVSDSIQSRKIIPSPFQLTKIQDLPPALNVDTVTLKDLLGDPLISECWEFNYLHDLDLLMGAFDPDVRDLVKVHVIHGFWKQEDGVGLKMQASRYSNVKLHTAYMPEAYGTHHTKMMVLLRHDDLAQVIIHTANLISRDWANLSQAVWRSPFLPLKQSAAKLVPENPPMGSGLKFKVDFLNYLRAYDTKRTICEPLIEQLKHYDFSEIRGALIASVPGRHHVDSITETKWGWQALRNVLGSVPTQKGDKPETVVQISSIATLGQTDAWLEKTLFSSLGMSRTKDSPIPKYKIIFPTADEVRRSLDGYQSGASIHTKIQTPAQAKQLQYLKPILHYWTGGSSQQIVPTVSGSSPMGASQTMPAGDVSSNIREAGRRRAAPHIKTYIRFANAAKTELDWALVTSANISKQAWGEACNKFGEVRISSYELGVLIWPELYGDHAKMVPTFKQDIPQTETSPAGTGSVVGFRMPYDLPLIRYSSGDEPWCASKSYEEPDWRGRTWRNG